MALSYLRLLSERSPAHRAKVHAHENRFFDPQANLCLRRERFSDPRAKLRTRRERSPEHRTNRCTHGNRSPERLKREGGRCRQPWLSGPPSVEISLSAAAVAAKIDEWVNGWMGMQIDGWMGG